jgi:hypothetical protein
MMVLAAFLAVGDRVHDHDAFFSFYRLKCRDAPRLMVRNGSAFTGVKGLQRRG